MITSYIYEKKLLEHSVNKLDNNFAVFIFSLIINKLNLNYKLLFLKNAKTTKWSIFTKLLLRENDFLKSELCGKKSTFLSIFDDQLEKTKHSVTAESSINKDKKKITTSIVHDAQCIYQYILYKEK